MQPTFAQRHPGVSHNPDARPEPLPWLVEGLWLKGKITALLGAEKSGKSRLACYLMAQMLATPPGSVVLRTEGAAPRARHFGFKRILYLNAEERAVDVQARINSFARYLGFEPRADWPITYVDAASMQLQRPAERAGFEEAYLASQEYDVVFIDPLRRVHTGNENDNSAMAPLHNDLRRWSNKYGTSILLAHHTPKLNEDSDLTRMATWSRGATDLVTLVDGANCLRATGEGSGYVMRELRRMGRFPPMEHLTLRDNGEPAGFVVSSSNAAG